MSSGRFSYICREILVFLDLDKQGSERSESFGGRTSKLMPISEGENFVDFFMEQMDVKVSNMHYITEEAFIPGNYEDIVHPSGNKKVDL